MRGDAKASEKKWTGKEKRSEMEEDRQCWEQP